MNPLRLLRQLPGRQQSFVTATSLTTGIHLKASVSLLEIMNYIDGCWGFNHINCLVTHG